jgi:hypothetical protein
MRIPTRLLTCIYAFRFDKAGTLSRQAGLKPATRARKGKRGGLLAMGWALCLLALWTIPIESQASNYKRVITKPKLQVIDYQIYTLKKLRSIRQFNCAVTLWNRESNWRPHARNGKHYGLVQGNSIYLKTATAYEQIDWGLRYIRSRYGVDEYNKTNVCLALGHSYKRLWY